MEQCEGPASSSPSSGQTSLAQLSAGERLARLTQQLPNEIRKAAETLWKAYNQRHTNPKIKEFFDCFEEYLRQPDAGSVKIYSCRSAETFGADKALLRQVNMHQQLLIESTNLEECNTVILFCPVNFRIRSDVEAAMSRVPGNKDTILVLMHHTRKADYSADDTAWSQIFPNVIMNVDVLFHETEGGLLRCPKNENAIHQIQQELQKSSNIRKPTNTVGAQGHLLPDEGQKMVKSNKHSSYAANPLNCTVL